MYCLANICYVCLEKKDKLLSNINSSLLLNKDIIHIIGYLPFNLTWLKTLRMICEECCIRLRDMCQFLAKCFKNSALLQSYRDNLNTTPISNTENEAELFVKLNIAHKDMHEEKCEIQLGDEEIYKFQWKPNIEEIENVFVDFEDSLVREGIICKKEVDEKQDSNSTEIIEEPEEMFVNLEDYFVKEENTFKQVVDDTEEYPTDNNTTESMNNESNSEISDNYSTEIIEGTEDIFVKLEDYFVQDENTSNREKVEDKEEYPTDNNSTDNMDNASDSEISVNDNAQLTNADCDSSGFTCKQVHATNKNDLNTAAKNLHKCSSSVTKSNLNGHSQSQAGKISYECATCIKRFSYKESLVRHLRLHTGKKPYECSECKKCFPDRWNLMRHMRIHTREKPCECSECKKCFSDQWHLMRHMRIHTGEKPYECSTCKKCFSDQWNLVRHMRIHTGEKPYECSTCKKCFTQHSHFISHMQTHTGKKP